MAAPTLWNSPAFPVTWAMASGLCARRWSMNRPMAETIACLMQEAHVNEAASMFEEVTGKPLKPRTAR